MEKYQMRTNKLKSPKDMLPELTSGQKENVKEVPPQPSPKKTQPVRNVPDRFELKHNTDKYLTHHSSYDFIIPPLQTKYSSGNNFSPFFIERK